MALFIGGDIVFLEWDSYKNLWGGMIIGTHCPVKNSDFEIVFISSGSSYSYYRTSDGYGDEYISFSEPFSRN